MLHHNLISDPGRAPARQMLFLHGIFGTGSNWRSFARRFVAAAPPGPEGPWGAALLDLRMHGGSQGLPPPHTLASAAADLTELCGGLALPVAGVLGHSFGGKVALRWLVSGAPQVEEAWIIDSTPAARPAARGSEETVAVLDALRELGPVHPSREAFVAALTGRGFAPALATWLAMNLQHGPEGMRLRLDLDAIAALLADYFQTDLWPALESLPGRTRLRFVVGGRSPVFSPEDHERARGLLERGRDVRVHVLPEAGHFVHVDDPDGLLGLMVQEIDR